MFDFTNGVDEVVWPLVLKQRLETTRSRRKSHFFVCQTKPKRARTQEYSLLDKESAIDKRLHTSDLFTQDKLQKMANFFKLQSIATHPRQPKIITNTELLCTCRVVVNKAGTLF